MTRLYGFFKPSSLDSNIDSGNGAKSKVGFGMYKSTTYTYNTLVTTQPGYINAILPKLSNDPNCYGPHENIFYRWLKYHEHVKPRNGDMKGGKKGTTGKKPTSEGIVKEGW